MAWKHRLRDAMLHPAARVGRRPDHGGDTVLIFQPDHLGDILLAQPAARIIRARYPNQRLVAVVGPWSRSITSIVWPVDDIVTMNYPGFDRGDGAINTVAPYWQLREARSHLLELQAGAAFVLRPDAWWAAWLASLVTSGPVVTSGDLRVAPFGTHRANLENDHHATARAIKIASQLNASAAAGQITPGAYPLTIPRQASSAAHTVNLLHAFGVQQEYIVIHPGAGADVKLWPADRWRRVIADLTSTGVAVLVTGSDAETELAHAVAAGLSNVHNLAGRTPLPVLIELLRRAQLVLGPDSGPLHLAVACGTPTVHLYGPSEPERFGPWGPASKHRIVRGNWSCPRCGDLSSDRCAGCGCMLSIDTRAVIEAAMGLRAALANP